MYNNVYHDIHHWLLISYYHTCCVNAVFQTSTCLSQDLLSRSPKAMTAAGHDDSSPVEDGPEEMAEARWKTGRHL